MFNPSTIKEKPLCEMCGIEKVLVLYGWRLVCGRCAIKLDEINNKFLQKLDELRDKFISTELKKEDDKEMSSLQWSILHNGSHRRLCAFMQ